MELLNVTNLLPKLINYSTWYSDYWENAALVYFETVNALSALDLQCISRNSKSLLCSKYLGCDIKFA